MADLKLTSPSFVDGAYIPGENSFKGGNRSPELHIENISPDGISMAIVMDDVTRENKPVNHWYIWNIPCSFDIIPAGIPNESTVSVLGDAVQGGAYYQHHYNGPKNVIGDAHNYRFTVYVLDCMIECKSTLFSSEMLDLTRGHILQEATLMGKYKNGKQ